MKNYQYSQDALDHRDSPDLQNIKDQKTSKKYLSPLELARLQIEKLMKEMK